jgi:D-arabinose 1-dehydrogenase-like Zn-dependent alcohol dehydrogenase
MDSFNLAVLSMNSGRRFYCRDDKVEKLARLSIPSVMVKNARLQGVSHGSRDDMEEMLAFVDNHRLSPIIDARYSFDALPDALNHLDRGPFGKLVVEIN